MLTPTELLELYQAEKRDLDFASDPFMSFAEWKDEFVTEYRKNHVSVDVKQALAEADALVEEAEAELFNDEEETDMSETNVVNVETAVAGATVDLDKQAELDAKREAKNARRRAQRAAAKAAAAKPKAKAKAPAKAKVARKDNKTAQARAIFTKMYGKKPRKDVIAKFMSDVGLSAPGASTYYQKLKKEVA